MEEPLVQVIILVVVLLGSAAGLWFGLVDDLEAAFLAGVLGLAIVTVAVFAGGYPQRPVPTASSAASSRRPALFLLQKTGNAALVLAAFLGGAAGVWFGFVEDLKWAFPLGLAAWTLGTLVTFGGGLPLPDLTTRSNRGQTRTTDGAATLGYTAAVLAGTFAGAAGVWFALVDDIEYLFPLGLAAWAGAFIIAFRGSATGRGHEREGAFHADH